MLGRILLVSLLFVGCAQVGQLEGGAVDRVAPKPIMRKSKPLNETTNYTGSSIELVFDEYITLNNPSENLIVVPPNIRPQVSKKGRVVKITWDDSLLNNTTYSFYFNGLVQDLTEKNDSIMQFVFSTGSSIDSLSANFQVVDAESDKALEKYTVGLYEKYTDSTKPIYFTRTNKQGVANLKYMKAGQYEVLAFQDLNKDLLLQANEKRAFLSSPIEPVFADSTVTKLYAFTPEQELGISSFTYLPPYGFRIGLYGSDSNRILKLNGKQILETHLYPITSDSLHFVYDGPDTNSFELVFESNRFADTNRIRIKRTDLNLNANLEEIKIEDALAKSDWVFLPTAPILYAPDSLELILSPDSSKVFAPIEFQPAFLKVSTVPFDQVEGQSLSLSPSQIKLKNAITDTLSFTRKVIPSKSLGVIRVIADSAQQGNVLRMIKENKSLRELVIPESGVLEFTDVAPGEYRFEIIVDTDKNGCWTTGNLKIKRQPETLYRFPKTSKLRPSWELEVELLPSIDE